MATTRRNAKTQKAPVISLVKGATPNYRSGTARANWLSLLQSCEGKTPEQFAEAALANPPSTPKNGKLAGQCEPPMGWLRYFVRQGIARVA